ncbi:hypothetical protein [Anabaena sphaerica]|uniref:hypothetical protein n=1 Tax=Anabaena sphaerica TaxID=212446 RepID=UPI001F552E5E|nr:hypothetical protein [Anabaena sphaerica]
MRQAPKLNRSAEAHGEASRVFSPYLDKITTYLSKNHAVIGIEDLNVSGMLADAKAIADMGFYEFRRQFRVQGSTLW